MCRHYAWVISSDALANFSFAFFLLSGSRDCIQGLAFAGQELYP
jgi:hypothetical protein